jgi:23S rRNA (guanosine2251-2'-O)-methyltransferase
MRQIVLIIHDVRSAHNVGSLLRTAEGLGIERVLISGYSPYPPMKDDERLPHLAEKTGRQISKTTLGAEDLISWRHIDDLAMSLEQLSARGFVIAALEQTDSAKTIKDYAAPDKIALIVGNEVAGIDERSLKLTDIHLTIPMLGHKESFNVSAAAAMALYHLRYS